MEDSYWVRRLGHKKAKVRAERIRISVTKYHASKTLEQKRDFNEKMAKAGELGRQRIKELAEDPKWKAWWLNSSLRSAKAMEKCAISTKRYWDSLPMDIKESYIKRTIHSEESRKKASATIRKWWDNATEEERAIRAKAFTKGLHRKPNKPETSVLTYLNSKFPNEWKYVGDGGVWMGNRNPDFININGKKLVINVFGSYWHQEEEVKPLKAHYKKFGFDCVIIWEEDCYDEKRLGEILDVVKAKG